MVRSSILTFVSACVMLFTFFSFCDAAPHGKPLAPLSIAITPTQQDLAPADIKPGDAVEFTATAESFADTGELDLFVAFLGGAELVSGDTSWTGPSAANEKKSVVFTVRAPLKGLGKIRARAVIPPSQGAAYTIDTTYTLGAEVKAKPAPKPPVRKDSQGRTILEYRTVR